MSVRSAVELLRQIPLFEEVDTPHLQTLLFSSDELVIPAGGTVFEAGEKATSALLVKEGEAVALDPSGGVVALAGPGAFLGELSMIAGLPRALTVKANTEVIAIAIERTVFLRLCSEFPEVGIRVLNVLNRQLGLNSSELERVKGYFEVKPHPIAEPED